MKRRDFLKYSSLASSSLLVPSFLRGFNYIPSIETDKNLVIIQLSGGNDGLNTIVPLDNDIYHNLRPSLALQKNDLIDLGSNLGLNKNAPFLERLFKDGELSIINNVGYPNPNRSHFRSTDIWHSASSANDYVNTGWIGRYLDSNCTSSHEALQIKEQLSLLSKGEKVKGLAVNNFKKLYNSTRAPFFKKIIENHNPQNENLDYLYKTLIETSSSAKYIYKNTIGISDAFEYPNTQLGKKLKMISQIIKSPVNTKVYFATLGGFDTHANQTTKQNNLLQKYSEAIEAFTNDLKKSGEFKNTLIFTFSEFGRRVKQNGSKGTDHGTANNVFVMGENLKKPGFYNNGPDLQNLDANGDLKYNIDFRTVYSTILENWLNVDSEVILKQKFSKLGFV